MLLFSSFEFVLFLVSSVLLAEASEVPEAVPDVEDHQLLLLWVSESIAFEQLNTSSNKAIASAFGAGAIYTDKSRVNLTRTIIETNTATGGTALTSSNYADALYVRYPLKIFIQDSTFNPLVWGGKTVSIMPRIVNPGA